MKKIIVLMLVLSMAMALFASGSPEQATSGTDFNNVTLKYGTTAAEGSLSVNAMRMFADKVKAATDGAVVIDIYPGSQLGGSNELLEQCQLGTIAMTNSSPAQMTNAGVKEMSVLGLPYLYANYDHYWNVLYGEVGQKFLDIITEKAQGVVGFGYIADGARHFFLNKDVQKLEDMKGLKIRVQDTSIDNAWCRALGASPTPTATSEIYSSMSNGLVDGAEQPLAGYYSSKYYEVSKYLILDGHTYNLLIPIFSESVWNGLNSKTQQMLKDCWKETMDEEKQIIVDGQQKYVELIKEKGVVVSTPSDLDAWAAAMDSVYAQFGAGYEKEIAEIKAVKY